MTMASLNAIESIGNTRTRFNRRLRCCICGFSEVRTDEVLDGDRIFLAECPRCEHRWTSREPIVAHSTPAPLFAALRFERGLSREVLPAA